MTTMEFIRRQPVVTTLALLGLLAVAMAIGFKLGASDGQASLQRIQLIWPDVAALSERDRAVLDVLSKHCDLKSVPMDETSVALCLRRAAGDPRLPLPPGVDDGKVELTRILRKASAAGTST